MYQYQQETQLADPMQDYNERMTKMRDMLSESWASRQREAERIAEEESAAMAQAEGDAVERGVDEAGTDIHRAAGRGAAMGASMGSVVPGVGTAFGALGGAALGAGAGMAGDYSTRREAGEGRFSAGLNTVKDLSNPVKALKGIGGMFGIGGGSEPQVQQALATVAQNEGTRIKQGAVSDAQTDLYDQYSQLGGAGAPGGELNMDAGQQQAPLAFEGGDPQMPSQGTGFEGMPSLQGPGAQQAPSLLKNRRI